MSEHMLTNPATSLHHNTQSVSTEAFSLDFISLMRIIFYFLVFIKIVSLSFFRRRTITLKERIYRKFLFAHNELLKQFSDEDKANMETTLNNTLKNSKIEYDPNSSKIRRAIKKVNFQTEKNKYYEPKKWSEEDLFKDIQSKEMSKPFEAEESFEEKKIEDQFHEREDLLGLEDKTEQMEESDNSKLTQNTQPSQLNKKTDDISKENAEKTEQKNSLI